MTISQAKFEPETHHHDESIDTIDTAISFDCEISQTSLEMNIDYLEAEKSKLSGKEGQSLRNELDLILLKARARLDKLQSLTLLEINLERILIDQKQISARQNRYQAKDIRFDRIRSMENGLLDNSFTKESEVNDQKDPVQKPRKSLEDILRDLDISLPSREELVIDAMTFEEPTTHYTSTSVEVPTVAPSQEEVEGIIKYLKDQRIEFQMKRIYCLKLR